MRLLRAAELPSRIILGDDLLIEADADCVLPRLPDGRVRADLHRPAVQHRSDASARAGSRSTRDDDAGDRTGFGGRRYRSTARGELAYARSLRRLRRRSSHRSSSARSELLAPEGTLYVHLDYREAHYVKVALDAIFGRDCFLNEIIWAYDYGAQAGAPLAGQARHDPRLRPRPATLPLRRRGRRPRALHGAGARRRRRRRRAASVRRTSGGTRSSPTSGRERTGYPTQKPEGVLRRIVAASSRPGGWCLDFFAGSGTLGAVCAELDRRFVLVDSNPQAIEIAARRLAS